MCCNVQWCTAWYIVRPSRSPTQRQCHESEFTCNDGRCITHLRRCDNIYDCMDFSDEQNCHNSGTDAIFTYIGMLNACWTLYIVSNPDLLSLAVMKVVLFLWLKYTLSIINSVVLFKFSFICGMLHFTALDVYIIWFFMLYT